MQMVSLTSGSPPTPLEHRSEIEGAEELQLVNVLGDEGSGGVD